MYILYNTDGSVLKKNLTDYIQKGNNNVNSIFVAINGIDYEWTLAALFELPNGDINSVTPTFDDDYEIDGQTYEGWVVPITAEQTIYEGILKLSLEADYNTNQTLFTATVKLVVNPAVAEPDETTITYAQYFALLNLVNQKLTNKQTIVAIDDFDVDVSEYEDGQLFLVRQSASQNQNPCFAQKANGSLTGLTFGSSSTNRINLNDYQESGTTEKAIIEFIDGGSSIQEDEGYLTLWSGSSSKKLELKDDLSYNNKRILNVDDLSGCFKYVTINNSGTLGDLADLIGNEKSAVFKYRDTDYIGYIEKFSSFQYRFLFAQIGSTDRYVGTAVNKNTQLSSILYSLSSYYSPYALKSEEGTHLYLHTFSGFTIYQGCTVSAISMHSGAVTASHLDRFNTVLEINGFATGGGISYKLPVLSIYYQSETNSLFITYVSGTSISTQTITDFTNLSDTVREL